ncbi:aminotransferase class III-fold pyridoxal phosphate-dependent enzyme [Ottowia caeni]|uniref:aminotransferase class III-fold pyridoxal phosphate-dependent enzyme n=1 Tax=Ottowia caeni TaxID=2870339 RepID=UPI001E4423F4|nr:aminotransferase class III-fold pyridoxal phosphate-dependent enzyme [Ottowia caeni]
MQLQQGLLELASRHDLGEIRGAGLLWAMELGSISAIEVVNGCRQEGLMVNAARPHCLRFMPRLSSTADEIQIGLAILSEVLSQGMGGFD